MKTNELGIPNSVSFSHEDTSLHLQNTAWISSLVVKKFLKVREIIIAVQGKLKTPDGLVVFGLDSPAEAFLPALGECISAALVKFPKAITKSVATTLAHVPISMFVASSSVSHSANS